MPFESARFLLFLLSALTVFWALRRSRPAQKLLLIAASVWFYGSYGWEFVALLGLSVAGNHLAAGLVAASEGPGRGRWLAVGVTANLLLLAWFKYYVFFAETFNDALFALGAGAQLQVPQIVLPIGISFYTFQAIAYLIEVHRSRARRRRAWSISPCSWRSFPSC